MEPRKASVALLYNGKNATAQVSPYLASFTYTDVSSGSSDTISVELNDRDRKWIGPWFPQIGDRLKPTIRTQNWDADNIKTSFLCGAFCVDDFSFKGNPIKMSLDGVAIPATSSFKSTKHTQTYEKTNLKEIGQKVAERAGIALFYEAKEMTIEKVEQNDQDDCSFYNSLVTKYGFAMKIFNDKIVVFDEATYEQKPTIAILTEKDFDPNWSWNTSISGTYTGVKYEYTNSKKNKTFTVEAGDGDRILTCNEAAENLTEATAIALAALNSANKGTTTLNLTLKGKWYIFATACVLIVGLGKLSGKYYVDKAIHTLGGDSGYKTALRLRKVEKRITDVKTQSSTVAERSKSQKSSSSQNSESASSGTPTKGDTYELKTTKKGYYTAAEAAAGQVKPGNPSGVRRPGTYYVFNTSQGMLNLTTAKSVPGSWINPN